MNVFKGLIPFLVGVSQKLVSKKVWTQSTLWEGFIRFSTIIFPSSIPVLLSLPRDRGVQVVQKSPKLAQAIKDHFQSLPAHQRGRRDLVQLSRLLEEARQAEQ